MGRYLERCPGIMDIKKSLMINPSRLCIMRFRDRDAPITPEGLLFRTYGYDHPVNACFCDLEYAPDTLYSTEDPRAVRDGGEERYLKFYFDGGMKFIRDHFPHYQILHEPLGRSLVGVNEGQQDRVIRPDDRLQEQMRVDGDPLNNVLKDLLNLILDNSDLKSLDFGVFGSIAHGFHNPLYSDVDLIIYGKKQLGELRRTLYKLYDEGALRNEFEEWSSDEPPAHWNFTRYSKDEYGLYQERKMIYSLLDSERLNRTVKIEFEPVRRWDEIENEYGLTNSIKNLGRVEAVVEVLSDDEAGFMPSVYPVKTREISSEINLHDLTRIVSYVEEFRLQVMAGEKALVRGDLELVETSNEQFYQITLSYGPNYFDQVLKTL